MAERTIFQNDLQKKPLNIGDILFHNKRSKEFDGLSHAEFKKNYALTNRDGTVYFPLFCSLINKIREDLNKVPFNEFQEMAFSRIISEDTAKRFGLIRAWPYILFTVEAFKANKRKKIIPRKGKKRFLDPVQCAPFYSWISGKVFTLDELPLKVYERLGGWSYRNETASRIRTAIRDFEFIRDEYIFVGTEQQVKEIRVSLLESVCGFLERQETEFRIVIGRGCFQEEEIKLKEKLQLISKPMDIPVIDIEMFIPEMNIWLEILGASHWGKKQVENFNIKGLDFQLTSGCVGIGISRLAYSLLAQNKTILGGESEKN